MSTDLRLQIKSTSSEQTEHIAARIGARLVGGEIIVLKSDLGGGKTTFTRGLVRGTGSTDVVSSPTFTISKIYNAPKFTVHHFDFYRLSEPGMVGAELEELIGDTSVVLVLEWPGVIHELLPPEKVIIDIQTAGEELRELTFTYPNSLMYLLEELA
jgi:tRNA threonylcarbamoyladenosine biosynthesis protein TsaE